MKFLNFSKLPVRIRTDWGTSMTHGAVKRLILKGPLGPALYILAQKVLQYNDMRLQPHKEMCAAIAYPRKKLKNGKLRRTTRIIKVPRDCFKTSLYSEALPILLILRDPNIRILITSSDADLSSKIVTNIEGHFQNNQILRKMFGDYVHEDLWNQQQFAVSKRTKLHLKEPTVDSGSVGAGVTGMHYDWIICDDLHNEQNTKTPDRIKTVCDYTDALRPVLAPDGFFLHVGTSWDKNDVLEYVERKDKFLDMVYSRGCYDGPDGLFFPDRLTHEFLEDTRGSMPAKRFACWYLNIPMTATERTFDVSYMKTESFSVIPKEEGYPELYRRGWPPVPIVVSMTVDPAAKDKLSNDYTALIVRGLDSEKNWWIIHAEQIRAPAPNIIINRIFELAQTFGVTSIYVESVGFQSWLKPIMKDAMIEKQIFCNYEALPAPRNNKAYRVSALEPKFQRGQIIFHPSCQTLADQYRDYPQVLHDDLLDALSMFLLIKTEAKPPKPTIYKPAYRKDLAQWAVEMTPEQWRKTKKGQYGWLLKDVHNTIA